jgi:hypothetical protein
VDSIGGAITSVKVESIERAEVTQTAVNTSVEGVPESDADKIGGENSTGTNVVEEVELFRSTSGEVASTRLVLRALVGRFSTSKQ